MNQEDKIFNIELKIDGNYDYFNKNSETTRTKRIIEEINLSAIKRKYERGDKLSDFEKFFLMLLFDNKREMIKFSKGDEKLESLCRELIKLYENPEFIKETEEYLVDKGKNEIKNAKYDVAENMLYEGCSYDLIKEATGLTTEEIDKIEIKE